MTLRADSLIEGPRDSRDAHDARRVRVVRFAWGALAYTVAVILFGAVVRITGSGAGCGQHWPTCQGEIAHLPKTLETAIEFTHRLTSGLSVLTVGALLVLVFRTFEKGHGARRAVSVAASMMVVESLVGAALVLLGLVGKNASAARAGVMAVHLVSTSLLTGSLALTAFFASGRKIRHFFPQCPLEWSLFGALGSVVVVSVTGAVTALGDTLYPVDTTKAFGERLAADAAASFLERGRAVHPLVAFLAATLLVVVAWKTMEIRPRPAVVAGARAVIGLVFAQVLAGVLNVALSAPPFMQVIHLAIATAVWVALVLCYATAMQPSSS
jgi:cytochrome c oxidase assembly protein subunit 15